MKKLKFLILLLLLATFNIAATAQNSLVIYLTDGSTAVFPLAELPEITFEGENFKVVAKQANIELPRTEVKEFKFEDRESTAIEDVTEEGDNATFNAGNNYITIDGIANGTQVTIFNIKGQKVLASTATNNSCCISLESLTAGLYIINYNSTTIKFLKK